MAKGKHGTRERGGNLPLEPASRLSTSTGMREDTLKDLVLIGIKEELVGRCFFWLGAGVGRTRDLGGARMVKSPGSLLSCGSTWRQPLGDIHHSRPCRFQPQSHRVHRLWQKSKKGMICSPIGLFRPIANGAPGVEVWCARLP